jgi:hypothetical protein
MNTLAYLHSFTIEIEEKYVESNEDSTHELFFLFLFSQLWCSQMDDYPEEDLNKFAYRAYMNLET